MPLGDREGGRALRFKSGDLPDAVRKRLFQTTSNWSYEKEKVK